jgi:hypothetical protein
MGFCHVMWQVVYPAMGRTSDRNWMASKRADVGRLQGLGALAATGVAHREFGALAALHVHATISVSPRPLARRAHCFSGHGLRQRRTRNLTTCVDIVAEFGALSRPCRMPYSSHMA